MADKYKTERGKMVKHQGILIDVRENGSVHIQIDGGNLESSQYLNLSEDQASRLYGLLGDVTHWDQLTESRANKLGDALDAEDGKP